MVLLKVFVMLFAWLLIAVLSFFVVDATATGGTMGIYVFYLIITGIGIAMHVIWQILRVFLNSSVSVVVKTTTGYIFYLVSLLVAGLVDGNFKLVVGLFSYSLIYLVAVAVTEFTYPAIEERSKAQKLPRGS